MAKKPVATKKTVKKTVTKKIKPVAKPVAKKVVPKKATPAKVVPKKAVPAKPVKAVKAVKAVSKKTSALPVKKKIVAKQPVKKTVPAKKVEPKKNEPKKIIIPKAVLPVRKTPVIVRPATKEPEKPKTKPSTARYSKAELEHFKQLILDRQSEILEQLQNLRDQVLDPTTGEYINENSPYSLHMAEQGSDAMEREKIYLYAQRENKFLGYLEEALKRIETGTYGLCIECIDEPKLLCPTCPLIPKPRLTAVPHSQLCVEIKNRQEKNKR